MVTTRLNRIGLEDGSIAVVFDPELAYLSGTYPDFNNVKEAEYRSWLAELGRRTPKIPVFYFDTFSDLPSGHASHWTSAIDQAAELTHGHIVLVPAHVCSNLAEGLAGSRFAHRVTSVLQTPLYPDNPGRRFYPRLRQLTNVVDSTRVNGPLWPCDPAVVNEIALRADATSRLQDRLTDNGEQLRTQLPVLFHSSTSDASSVAVVAFGNPATCDTVRYTEERLRPYELGIHDPHYGLVPPTLRWKPEEFDTMGNTAFVRLLSDAPNPDFTRRVVDEVCSLSFRSDAPTFEKVIASRPYRLAQRSTLRSLPARGGPSPASGFSPLDERGPTRWSR